MARNRSGRPDLPDDIMALLSGLRWVSVGSGIVAAAVVGLLLTSWAVQLGGWRTSVPEAAGRQAALAALQGWTAFPSGAPAPCLLAAWIFAGIVGLGALSIIIGKWLLLGGIDDAPTRGTVTRSYLLDLLGWTCAFVSPYLAAFGWKGPANYAPPLLSNVARLSLVFGALLMIAFVARAAYVLSHEELQERAISIGKWLRVLVFACILGALCDVVLLLPLAQNVRQRIGPIAGYASIAVRVLTVLLAVILWIRQASTAARTRKALRLSAEALSTPVPETFV